MKTVVLAGPESSGKSWLGGVLQARYEGLLVREYVREFIEQAGRDTVYADIDAIARGQLANEAWARQQQPRLLILDTHLLSNMLWSRTLFGDCPAWLEPALLAQPYDLHLLLSPDGVPWVHDSQRCQPNLMDRQAFFAQSERWLRENDQPYQVLHGSWSDRQAAALSAVERLLARP
ncbi:MAG: AAA family ATPase [Pseudomonas sp.]|uniref:AAA family ATPase n=1 Tax=Pseudomonas abieticivorans TaxID=2931382 RepID=UPI0020BD7705|nr:AAA family ATPase [Pseudomonas sp. PIA16]MDE1166554.1 AAA family ATPase [Pseudomonas sp.]